MGTNSAMLTQKVIENIFEVLSIELLAILQAIDYLQIEGKLSDKTASIYQSLRSIAPVFVEDSVKYELILKLKNYLKEQSVPLG
jgi:histidine ammonia-lyase